MIEHLKRISEELNVLRVSTEGISESVRSLTNVVDDWALEVEAAPEPDPVPETTPAPFPTPNGIVTPPAPPNSAPIIISANEGTRVIDQSDTNLEIMTGVRVDRIEIRKGVQRVRIAGGEVGSIGMDLAYVNWPDQWDQALIQKDILIENCAIRADNSVNIALYVQAERCLIRNCQVSGPNFAMYVRTDNNYAHNQHGIVLRDIAVEGCHFHARDVDPSTTSEDQSCVRMLHVDGMYFANNIVQMDDLYKQSFRLHNGVKNALVEDNDFIYAGCAFGSMPNDTIGDIVFRRNKVLYFRNTDLFHIGRAQNGEGDVGAFEAYDNEFNLTPQAGDPNNAIARYMPPRTTAAEDAKWSVHDNTVNWIDNAGAVTNTWNG